MFLDSITTIVLGIITLLVAITSKRYRHTIQSTLVKIPRRMFGSASRKSIYKIYLKILTLDLDGCTIDDRDAGNVEVHQRRRYDLEWQGDQFRQERFA